MYRSHNPKIAVAGELRGKYELFWVAENAEHLVKREADPSHQMSIKDVERFAAWATYVVYGQRANYRLAYGLGLWQQKYYHVVCYLVDKPYKRCMLETCHVVNQYPLLQICKRLFPKNQAE